MFAALLALMPECLSDVESRCRIHRFDGEGMLEQIDLGPGVDRSPLGALQPHEFRRLSPALRHQIDESTHQPQSENYFGHHSRSEPPTFGGKAPVACNHSHQSHYQNGVGRNLHIEINPRMDQNSY